MKKRKRRHYSNKTNKSRKYMVALLLILTLSLIVGVVYSRTKPKKNVPDEVTSIVNQLNEVEDE